MRTIGIILIVIPALLLLFIGLLGMGQAGIFGGSGFIGPIYVTLIYFGPFFVVPVLIGIVAIVTAKKRDVTRGPTGP